MKSLLKITLLATLVSTAVYASDAGKQCKDLERYSPYNSYNCEINGNCTWYAAHRMPETNFHHRIVNGKTERNAHTWLERAKLRGLPTSEKPIKDSIAVFDEGYQNSKVGHVAVVEEVRGNTVER